MAEESWVRLRGGPCDGAPAWTTPDCLLLVAARDSDRQGWLLHSVAAGEPLTASDAHLYRRTAGEKDFTYVPEGLTLDHFGGQAVWQLRESLGGPDDR